MNTPEFQGFSPIEFIDLGCGRTMAEWCDCTTPFTLISGTLVRDCPSFFERIPWVLLPYAYDAEHDIWVYERVNMRSLGLGIVQKGTEVKTV